MVRQLVVMVWLCFWYLVNVRIEVLGGSSLVGRTVGLVVVEGCVGRDNGVGRIGLMVV